MNEIIAIIFFVVLVIIFIVTYKINSKNRINICNGCKEKNCCNRRGEE